MSWLPGLSGGAAATLASVGTRKSVGPSQFMVVLGAVSTSTALLSVAVLFIIHRARSGAAAAVRALAGDLSPWPSVWAAPVSLLLLVMSAVLATAIAAPLAGRVGRGGALREADIARGIRERARPTLLRPREPAAGEGPRGRDSGPADSGSDCQADGPPPPAREPHARPARARRSGAVR